MIDGLYFQTEMWSKVLNSEYCLLLFSFPFTELTIFFQIMYTYFPLKQFLSETQESLESGIFGFKSKIILLIIAWICQVLLIFQTYIFTHLHWRFYNPYMVTFHSVTYMIENIYVCYLVFWCHFCVCPLIKL